MRPLFCFALFCMALSLLTGCSSAPTQTQRYTFAVSTAPVREAPFIFTGGLGVGPVELPEFWRQREVVLVEKNKVISDDRHLWAGDPKLSLSRVIATNLSRQLQSNDVWAHPWDSRAKPQKQILLIIESFGGALGQPVEMVAKWRLLDDFGSRTLATEREVFTAAPADRSYAAYVAALNQLVDQLSLALERSARQNFSAAP
ncbi:MAG: PqiC family protein [Cellvibrionaceae bacterium]|nr:PqiC family protein [Cellvibrionaceae bacterium]